MYVLLHALTSFNGVRDVTFVWDIRQGYPISGLIFNLVIYMFLADMTTHEPFHINGAELSCLLFSDYIVLISSPNRVLQASVDSYSRRRVGLRPNPAKFTSLTITGWIHQRGILDSQPHLNIVRGRVTQGECNRIGVEVRKDVREWTCLFHDNLTDLFRADGVLGIFEFLSEIYFGKEHPCLGPYTIE
ncbi:unnamed protein product [Lepeophtheirus salmonis]|uniref:(salmon louse) hypothetical protein n=1 Tax=Lepeophtheirus salmonis TaxID=72036 RepID=A0A817FAX8_LEPSM|nr:unnamed protein product [Lepeophtheirus salmonis]CAG9476872.1 unnamed protein product [Lepeophtheirus salmonis]